MDSGKLITGYAVTPNGCKSYLVLGFKFTENFADGILQITHNGSVVGEYNPLCVKPEEMIKDMDVYLKNLKL